MRNLTKVLELLSLMNSAKQCVKESPLYKKKERPYYIALAKSLGLGGVRRRQGINIIHKITAFSHI